MYQTNRTMSYRQARLESLIEHVIRDGQPGFGFGFDGWYCQDVRIDV